MKHLTKNLALLTLAFALAGLANAAATFFEEDFEKYEAGTELVGSAEGWSFFGTYKGTSTIVEEGGLKALKLARKEGGSADYDMILTPTFTATPSMPGREFVKFSYKVKPSSNTDIFALYTTKEAEGGGLTYADRFFYLNAQVNDGKLASSPGGVTMENIKGGEWNDIYFLMDAMNGRVVEVGCNGEVKTCSITMETTYNSAVPIMLRLSTQYSSQTSYNATYYDFVKVESVTRSAEPSIIAPDTVYIKLEESSAQFDIYNGGPDADINYTISSPASWLTINPTSGILKDKKEVYLTPEAGMAEDCYETDITIDGGSYGSKTVRLVYQHGFFYKESFENLAEGDILAQDGRWQQIYGAHELGVYEEYNVAKGGADSSEKCLNHHQISGYGGTHTTFYGTEGLAAKYNFKLSFDVNFGSESASGNGLYFGSNDGAAGELKLNDNSGRLQLTSIAASYVFPETLDYQDKWIHVSYTINMLADNCQLLEMTFGENTVTGINATCTSSKDYFPRFRLFNWNSTVIKIDNLSIQAIKREASGPELAATGGGVAYLGTNTLYMTVYNLGSGEMEFESQVTDGAGWLAIKEAKGAESYKGKIVDTNSQKLTLEIDRATLGAQYGRAKIVTTAGDSVKVVSVAVQGSSDDGIVFYQSDFEDTELGTISAVDPAWLNANGQVFIDDDNRALKITSGGQTHFKVNIPAGLSERFNFRFSCKMKFPVEGAEYAGNCFGTDLGHRQGEYNISIDSENRIHLTSGDAHLDETNVTNTCPQCQWFPVSYTYNSDPLNRKLVSVTFGDSTYEINDYIDVATSGDYDYFNEFRIYTWSDKEPYYLDDVCMEAVPKSSDPPIMKVTAPSLPVTFDKDEVTITVRNDGGSYFNFASKVMEGGEYLKAETNGVVYGSFQFKAKIDRSKLGYGFYRPIVRFTSDKEESFIDLPLAIQSGSAKEGYVIYSSDFDSLELTAETEGGVANELSSQDCCWIKNTDHNRIDVVMDPIGKEKKVVKVINANDWTKYCGYNLQLNVKSNVWDNYDAVYSMDMLIPEDFVDRTGVEHSSATFFVSQDNSHRQCEFKFKLDTEDGSKPVMLEPQDIANTEWWSQNKESMAPVANSQWFKFYFRFNCKLLDYDHKTLYALNFGENEFQMTDDDSTLTYPGGVVESVLFNEAMPQMKLWCYCDNAGICLDNVKIMLVPKGLPEPAIMGLAALLLALLSRKRG